MWREPGAGPAGKTGQDRTNLPEVPALRRAGPALKTVADGVHRRPRATLVEGEFVSM